MKGMLHELEGDGGFRLLPVLWLSILRYLWKSPLWQVGQFCGMIASCFTAPLSLLASFCVCFLSHIRTRFFVGFFYPFPRLSPYRNGSFD